MSKKRDSQPSSDGVLQWLRKVIRCDCEAEVPNIEILNNKLIGLYFSASWCPPCQLFIPILAQGYKQIRDVHGPQSFEIIMVPLDTEEAHWRLHMTKMPWLSIALPQREAIVKLFTNFEVTEAPRLVIIDSNGTVVSENARGGEGFGFGCDPLVAYNKFVADAERLAAAARNAQ